MPMPLDTFDARATSDAGPVWDAALRNAVCAWMTEQALAYVDLGTGNLDATALMEAASRQFGIVDYEHDPTHWLWDLPRTVAQDLALRAEGAKP